MGRWRVFAEEFSSWIFRRVSLDFGGYESGGVGVRNKHRAAHAPGTKISIRKLCSCETLTDYYLCTEWEYWTVEMSSSPIVSQSDCWFKEIIIFFDNIEEIFMNECIVYNRVNVVCAYSKSLVFCVVHTMHLHFSLFRTFFLCLNILTLVQMWRM